MLVMFMIQIEFKQFTYLWFWACQMCPGPDRLIDESDLTNLPYLRGIIIETLRMYLAAALTPPHESSDQCTVGGFSIPQGTMLLVNLWAIQNDPKLWAEPGKFRPERFVTGPYRREGDSTRDGFRLLPFGAGRRRCPGEGLAMRMIGLGLGSHIQCFEWKRVGEEMVDMSEGAGLIMLKAVPLVARYMPRPIMLHLLSQLGYK
ncbi:hypothetical protein CDL15_Pgr014495 [Punica granatum]|uniref:Cytochrome P450 81D1-like n=1 Tax=Punica granatum TaxID=22663 RepID=A0A218WFI3_PUNGR|nr:hypothetical protein CDL15_Pgr014495 [Punica granatum]